jgi:hypothetical protein
LNTGRKALVILVADSNIESAVNGLLARHLSLGCAPIEADVYVHPERDPGCLTKAPDFLRPFAAQYEHSLVILDHEGCGQEIKAPSDLQAQVEHVLSVNGWGQRSRVIVIAPELEQWVWSDSPHVESTLGWEGGHLRPWLAERGLLSQDQVKPGDPKQAVEAALRAAHRPRSSSLYAELAGKVGLTTCTDPAFVRLREALQEWFPVQ